MFNNLGTPPQPPRILSIVVFLYNDNFFFKINQLPQRDSELFDRRYYAPVEYEAGKVVLFTVTDVEQTEKNIASISY